MTQTGLTNIPQPTSWSWTPKDGFKTRRVYKATTVSDRDGIEASLRAGGWSYDVTGQIEDGSNGFWEITATRGGNDPASDPGSGNNEDAPISDAWELSASLIEKDLLESDHALMIGLWSEAGQFKLPDETQEDCFARYVQLLKDIESNPASDLSVWGALPNGKILTKLILAGVKSQRVFQPTLRHNLVVSDQYSVQDALTNVGSVIYADSIQSVESIPNTILFNLPAGNDCAREDELGLRLKYGWLKKYPTVTELAGGEWSISQEWEFGLWHLDLYTFVS